MRVFKRFHAPSNPPGTQKKFPQVGAVLTHPHDHAVRPPTRFGTPDACHTDATGDGLGPSREHCACGVSFPDRLTDPQIKPKRTRSQQTRCRIGLLRRLQVGPEVAWQGARYSGTVSES